MMEFVHAVAFVLGLLSVGHSAPVTNCETLTQQVDVPAIDQFLGKWNYLADVTTLPASKLLTKLLVKNMWTKVTRANESNTIDIFQIQKSLGRCFSVSAKMTLENNTLSMSFPYESSQIRLRSSCPDCMVLQGNIIVRGNTFRSLQLTSRRGTLTPAELEEFKKQAECLNLPEPVFFDAENDLCPDESVTQQTESETTDLTSMINNEAVNEALKLLEKITANEGMLQELTKSLTSGVIPVKEN